MLKLREISREIDRQASLIKSQEAELDSLKETLGQSIGLLDCLLSRMAPSLIKADCDDKGNPLTEEDRDWLYQFYFRKVTDVTKGELDELDAYISFSLATGREALTEGQVKFYEYYCQKRLCAYGREDNNG